MKDTEIVIWEPVVSKIAAGSESGIDGQVFKAMVPGGYLVRYERWGLLSMVFVPNVKEEVDYGPAF